jgi:hypothetical protein
LRMWRTFHLLPKFSYEVLSQMDTLVMTPEEKIEYLNKVYNRLLEHRYHYYVLHDPILEDWLYDWMEKYYNKMAEEVGGKIMKMVDFDPNDATAILAKERVDSSTDDYSIWEKEMKPVWDRLGKTRKEVRKEKEDANRI